MDPARAGYSNGSMEDVSMSKYQRKAGGSLKTRDKKLKSLLKRSDESYKDATKEAADLEILHTESAGFLEAENEMEKTFKVSQKEILDSVDEATRAKRFILKLNQLGPYVSNYSQTGNHLLLGGRKGHVSSFNWKEGTLGCELQLGETVHDVQYLQNENEFFAVAQKKHVYIYDQFGAEVHQLVHHVGATRLEYLPYHYLLVTAGTSGYIKYQDVSTGQLVAELRGKMGPTTALTHNPYNGVVHTGQNNGTVALWAPNMPSPLAKILSSKGPVRSVAVDRGGNYMAVAGQDKSLKIWDIRSFRPLETYYSPTPASSLSISATGLLAVGWGPHIQIWKDTLTRTGPKISAPYMNHLIPGQQVQNVAFCPYEDVLGVGMSNGFESLIIPGSGEANIDALEANPYSYATRTGRRETQVRGLLEKLQPDMITLDPRDIGRVDSRSNSQRLSAAAQEAEEERKAAYEAQQLAARPGVKKNNSALRRLLRKKTQNVMDQRKLKIQQALEREKRARDRLRRDREGIPQEKETGAALRRFM